jgi:transglutaminase-like putative cysteine protease
MSKLYFTESGHVIPTLCEELTDYRHARKILHLPGTREPARLYVLARSYPDNQLPLRLSVNGTELAGVDPRRPDIYFWHEVVVPASLLVAGRNVFEFFTDSRAMDSWSLALENGHKEPESFVSTDCGATWRNEKLGYHNVSLGEYVVRLRLAEGEDAPPPPLVWEDRQHPRLKRLYDMIPDAARKPGTTLERVRSLATWICTTWEYRNTANATQYGPWDAETIMAWGKAQRGHNGQLPIVMCVHYAVALVSCCQAVGIPARPAVFTGSINGMNGHFTGEVWFKELEKWVMVDPTLDAVVYQQDQPLSVKEIQHLGAGLAAETEWGAGHEFQVQNPLVAAWIPSVFDKGLCFRHRSVWPRTDFLAHPELTPPGHGETAYSETGLVWEQRDLDEGFGMFPNFGDESYFDAPPAGF